MEAVFIVGKAILVLTSATCVAVLMAYATMRLIDYFDRDR